MVLMVECIWQVFQMIADSQWETDESQKVLRISKASD